MFIAWLIEMATLSLVLIVAFSKVRVLVLWLVAYLTLYAVNDAEVNCNWPKKVRNDQLLDIFFKKNVVKKEEKVQKTAVSSHIQL